MSDAADRVRGELRIALHNLGQVETCERASLLAWLEGMVNGMGGACAAELRAALVELDREEERPDEETDRKIMAPLVPRVARGQS